jgi:hypothetical protein
MLDDLQLPQLLFLQPFLGHMMCGKTAFNLQSQFVPKVIKIEQQNSVTDAICKKQPLGQSCAQLSCCQR